MARLARRRVGCACGLSGALLAAIAREIAADGPLTIARFMEIALHDPVHGYYARHPRLAGPDGEGDFLTAPEISQMFGELIGAWTIDTWRGISAPETFHLLEAGPGRGTMIADLWRVAQQAPDFRAAAQITLIERSHVLRAVQAEMLRECPVRWCETLEEALVPSAGAAPDKARPFILLANEFLDCLPIRQWRYQGQRLEERRITCDDTGLVFRWFPSPAGPAAMYGDGDVIETRAADRVLLELLARLMLAAPGIALFIDYGKARSGPGDTLQALAGHAKTDPLADPGGADLTAWVDFAALGRWGQSLGLDVFGPVPQGIFLKRLGIEARAARLAAGSPDKAAVIGRALARLTNATAMGGLFKVMAFASPGLLGRGPHRGPGAPAGFVP